MSSNKDIACPCLKRRDAEADGVANRRTLTADVVVILGSSSPWWSIEI
jgi:hypothetical protein